MEQVASLSPRWTRENCNREIIKADSGLETKRCQIIRTSMGGESQLAIVDTPGFDDSDRPDVEVLEEITRILITQHKLGIPLKGIVFLHRITDQKMQGTSRRYFEMFRRIVGEKALSNVILTTTMWDKLKDEGEGLSRDQQLREQYWNSMEESGSQILCFNNSKEMAQEIMLTLLSKDSIVLDIQKELDQGKRLEDTAAGKLMVPQVEETLRRSRIDIQNLNLQMAGARKAGRRAEIEALEKSQRSVRETYNRRNEGRERLKRRPAEEAQKKVEVERTKLKKKDAKSSKWKDGLQIFAAVTGLAISIVFNVLPVFGVNIE